MTVTPRVKVHEDGRAAVYDPLSEEKLRQLAPGMLAETLWQRLGVRPWRLFWNPNEPLPDELDCRLTEQAVAGWSDAAVVPLVEPSVTDDAHGITAAFGDRVVARRYRLTGQSTVTINGIIGCGSPDDARATAAGLLSAAAWAEHAATYESAPPIEGAPAPSPAPSGPDEAATR